MGFSRQEYWSGLPFPSPGDLPDPGIKPRSPALQADALSSEPPLQGKGETEGMHVGEEEGPQKDLSSPGWKRPRQDSGACRGWGEVAECWEMGHHLPEQVIP